MAKIIVAGDLHPGERNSAAFTEGDRIALLGHLGDHLASADLVVANLECPLVDRPSPSTKSGWLLGCSTSGAAGIAACGVQVVGLANNHIMDHGISGLESTLAACADHGVKTFGAGKDLAAARRPLVLNVGDMRIGLIGATEPEFAAATLDTPGANPLEVASFSRDVRRAAMDVDHLVVLLHSGLEGHPYPTPRLRETCRLLLELGARAVVCQHSHVIGCGETHAGGVAIYGQGNFVFDWPEPTPPGWGVGILVELDLSITPPTVGLIPVKQNSPGARALAVTDAARVIDTYQQRSAEILESRGVEAAWKRACDERRESYLAGLAARSGLTARLLRRFRLSRLVLGRRRQEYLYAMLRAGHHRELLEEILP